MGKIRGFLKRNDEFLAIIVGLISSITVLLKTFNNDILGRVENIAVITDLLNLTVLFFGLYFIKKTILKVNQQELYNSSRKLNISIDFFSDKLVRTNSLIGQLTDSIKWFIIILVGFYGIQLFIDLTIDYDEIKSSLTNNDNLFDLLVDDYNSNLDAAKFFAVEIIANATNLFSATFLFTAFLVLFSVTLDSDNKTSTIKNYTSLSIAIGITILNIVCYIYGFLDLNLEETSTIIRLLGGLYNGVAMALLFSRLISMEYYFQHSYKSFERSFYFYGITVGLPLYIVVQPLYALLNIIDLSENSSSIFKAGVFLVTFWGKLVFLFFIYTMLNKKWIHSYILLSLIENDTLKKLSLELNDVEKLDFSSSK